jgi:hypothetical protein
LHRVGDALAADDSGPDEVEGVRGVDAGAGGAVGGSAVATADMQDAEGFLIRRVRPEDLTRNRVDGLGVASQPDRLGAVADSGGGGGPGVEIAGDEPGGDLLLEAR